MKVDITKNSREITVKTMRFPHLRGTVFYACSPYDPETIAGDSVSRTADKIHLVSVLMEHLGGMIDAPWTNSRFPNRADFPIQVVHDPLGRPQLLLGECEGPAISFSGGGENVWAALCGDGSDIGIDVTGTDEFHREYPFHRVFHLQELQHAFRLVGGDVEKASALLWSVKEAVVKALGCAFHLVDPLHITVYPSAEGAADGDVAYTFPVRLSGKALVRFPIAASGSLWVRSIPLAKMWLSIALLNRQHQCGDE